MQHAHAYVRVSRLCAVLCSNDPRAMLTSESKVEDANPEESAKHVLLGCMKTCRPAEDW